MTELSTDDEIKKLFQFLKEEEDRHVTAFEKIRDNQPKEARPEEYSEEMQAYMDSVVDDRLYSDVDTDEFVKKALDAKDVFRLAIGLEKDAILYFREFLPYVSESDQEIVKDLIDQEKGHIRMLSEMKKRLAE